LPAVLQALLRQGHRTGISVYVSVWSRFGVLFDDPVHRNRKIAMSFGHVGWIRFGSNRRVDNEFRNP